MKKSVCLSTLAISALVLMGCMTTSSAPEMVADGIVRVEQGELQGVVDGDVAVFRGVPYAAPPVGDLRWKEPVSPPAWDGVRDASENGGSCSEVEDCLYLNVWTPADANSESKLPVFIWIHGGGFAGGSGGRTDGSKFVQNDVIVVPINYRLSRAGWFAHPALTAENPDGLLANYGNMDQIAALEWVRENIEAFGGDPEKITVGGGSAGAISTAIMMLAPQSKGKFSKSISESNFGRLDFLPIRSDSGPSAESHGVDYANAMGISGTGADAAAKLRALSFQDLRKPAAELGISDRARPISDGKMIRSKIVDGFAAGEQAAIPYLFGNNSDESSLFRRGLDAEGRLAVMRTRDGFVSAFDPEETNDAGAIIARLQGDESNREPDREIARAHSGEAPTYVYYMTYVPKELRGERYGMGHGAETAYVFGQPFRDPFDEEGQALSDSVNAYWSAFIANGDPGDAGGTDWPEFDGSGESQLEFTGVGAPVVRNHIDKDRLDWVLAQIEN